MQTGLISTKEVAAMFNVAETTIKRWADESVLPCVRTPGGHRKFPLKEIMHFAEANGYALAGTKPPPMTPTQMKHVEFGVYSRTYERIAEVFRGQALQADRDGILRLFLYLYRHQIPLAVIIDEVVRPAFRSIGERWETGEIEIAREHAASQATMESLVRISPELHRKEANGMSALCACPEQELHEIGLRGLAYSLECEGWKVHYVGPNAPVETLASFVRAAQPELVCLSVTMGRGRAELAGGLKRIASLVHSYHGRFVVGGTGATKAREHGLPADHVARSIQDAIRYTRDAFELKPGPKKKSAAQERPRR